MCTSDLLAIQFAQVADPEQAIARATAKALDLAYNQRRMSAGWPTSALLEPPSSFDSDSDTGPRRTAPLRPLSMELPAQRQLLQQRMQRTDLVFVSAARSGSNTSVPMLPRSASIFSAHRGPAQHQNEELAPLAGRINLNSARASGWYNGGNQVRESVASGVWMSKGHAHGFWSGVDDGL